MVAGDNDESGKKHAQRAVYPPAYKSDFSDVYMKHGNKAVRDILNRKVEIVK